MVKPFPTEFRRDVVAVARKSETSLSQIAKDFGIGQSTLHKWIKQADIEEGVAPGSVKEDTILIQNLKKRNRVLEQENEILRKAAAFFARELPPK